MVTTFLEIIYRPTLMSNQNEDKTENMGLGNEMKTCPSYSYF